MSRRPSLQFKDSIKNTKKQKQKQTKKRSKNKKETKTKQKCLCSFNMWLSILKIYVFVGCYLVFA